MKPTVFPVLRILDACKFCAGKLQLEVINGDLRSGGTKTPEFLGKNPSGKIPVLELTDGTCIAETVAICRYLESLAQPNLGADLRNRANRSNPSAH